jgi:hypothetical protein
VMDIEDSSINGNETVGSGAGINNQGGLIIQDADIVGNFSPSSTGGGILNGAGASLEIHHGNISGNFATFDGGGAGINNQGDDVVINDNTTITNNYSETTGGGITNFGANFSLSDSTVSGNHAGLDGGGIANRGENFVISNTNIEDNESDSMCDVNGQNCVGDGIGNGGGIYNADVNSTMTITGNTNVSNNDAAQGGGIFNFGTIEIVGSHIDGNTAFGGGNDDNGQHDK